MRRQVIIRTGAVALLAAAGCLAATASSAAKAPLPSVRLRAVLHHSVIWRFPGERDTWLQPGTYLAAVGGTWELEVFRHKPGGPQLWQVVRDGGQVHKVRRIRTPAKILFEHGIPRFLNVTLADGSGHVVSRNVIGVCPNSYYMSRVTPDGPVQPTFPQDCGDALTHATIWGIDSGWANELAFPLQLKNVPNGRYKMTMTITRPYVRQFHIAPAQATATTWVHLRTFKKGPPPHRAAAAGAPSRVRPTLAQREQTTSDPLAGAGGLPDLEALPAHDLRLRTTRSGKEYLGFGATIWNSGSGPMVLEGFRHGTRRIMPATQFIYRNGRVVGQYRAGRFEFDTRHGHDHWHMEQIARYELLSSTGHKLLRSKKQSFCLAPTDAVNLTKPGVDLQPDQSGLWSACSGEDAIWIREVLPAGWGDTYYQDVAGQSFNTTDLPDGRYKLRVTADPPHALHETSYKDNVSVISIAIRGPKGNRTVTILH